ncbi:MAG TPA: hypothetical protein VHT75_03490, partial [Acidimicrobiales bacterium]|nr:hypothetical protein [Acidimicrobiales bacterium]
RDFSAVLELASRQFSVFATTQAYELGVSNSMLDRAVARGWIRSERLGVWVVTGAAPSPWRATYAAALAAGPHAAIAHASAGKIHGLYGIVAERPELTVPWNVVRKLEGVTTHRSRTLEVDDLQTHHGVKVTNPVRTIIDLAGCIREPLLGKMLDEAARARLATPEQILARLESLRRGVRGRAELARALGLRVGEGHPDSALEQRVIRLVKRFYPGYVLHHQVTVEGRVFVLDIAWPDRKIDGEVDGRLVHTSRSRFEQSSLRNNVLARNGWRIVHFTYGMDDRTILAQLAPYFCG